MTDLHDKILLLLSYLWRGIFYMILISHPSFIIIIKIGMTFSLIDSSLFRLRSLWRGMIEEKRLFDHVYWKLAVSYSLQILNLLML